MADWDDDEFVPAPVVPSSNAVSAVVDPTLIHEEEEEGEEKVSGVPKSVEKKEKKKIGAGKEGPSTVKDETLADPVAEKLRKQKLIEDADFKNAEEVFGDPRNPADLSPSSAAEFDDYGRLVAIKLLMKHEESIHYVTLLRSLLKRAMGSMSTADAKEIESLVVIIRNERLKAEKDATGAKSKKASKKKFLNAGSAGGAGGDLDDATFYRQSLDTDGADRDGEFM